MPIEELLKGIAQFGAAGLMFIMWYIERRDNTTLKTLSQNSQQREEDHVRVIQDNTAALVALKETLRTSNVQLD